jgi:cyanate permease
MLALIVAGYGAFGLVVASIAPLVTPILADTGMSRGALGTILGSWQFVYLFSAIPIGMLVDRFGLRWTVGAGIALIAASVALRAGASSYVTMLVAVMIFGLGGPFVSVGAPKLISTWFSSEEAGLAVGVYSIAPPAGQMFALATANSVFMPLTGHSWRLTLLCFAALALCAALAWLALARSPVPEASGDPEETHSPLAAFPVLLRLPVVRIVLAMAVGVFLVNHSLINWLPEILQSRGMSPSAAGFWAAVPTFVAIGAALAVPRLTSERRLTAVQIAVFGSTVAGLLLLLVGTGVVLLIGLALLGLGFGAAVPLLVLTLLRAEGVGQARMGAAGGLFFMAGEVGGVLGPSLTGLLAQLTGGYAAGLVGLTAVGVLLVLLAVPLGVAQAAPRR